MKALIDGDIIRYEIGFAAETGWRSIEGEDESLPPFDYVEALLHQRIDNIVALTGADEYKLFLTEGRTFRYDVAKTRAYKGQRKDNKPFHFDNLTTYITHCMPSEVVTKIEADDAIAIEHVRSNHQTIVCSRDKDLRQLPGWMYSWELGKQPSFGPEHISETGYLGLQNGKLTGTGFAFFCSQLLTGDIADNIPGLPGVGPVAAYNILANCISERCLMDAVHENYFKKIGDDYGDYLLEQGRLLWLVRKLNHDGTPVMWELGMLQ